MPLGLGPVRSLDGSKEQQVLADGEVVEQDVLLRTYPQLSSDRRQVCLQVLAVDDDGSRSGSVQSRQHGSARETKSAGTTEVAAASATESVPGNTAIIPACRRSLHSPLEVGKLTACDSCLGVCSYKSDFMSTGEEAG